LLGSDFPAPSVDGRFPEMDMCKYWRTVSIVGKKDNMMIEIATAGDFTVNANSADITTKIPTAGMAWRTAKITTPSCKDLLLSHCM
jgi:hypothetical protein